MPAQGQLAKMLILGFRDTKSAETGGKAEAIRNNAYYEALINPETFTHEFKVEYDTSSQAQGTTAQELKFKRIPPQDITFEFLFDNTGIIDGVPRDNIADDLKKFKDILIGYNGDGHQPNIIKLVWGGNEIFKGRVTELTINYKVFNAAGFPLRATVKVKFKSTVEDQAQVNNKNNQSPDLSHRRTVKAGDTLPLMCKRIYGDPSFYLQVAAFNGIENFRILKPGLQITFPAVAKT